MIPALWLGALLSFQAVGADAGAAGQLADAGPAAVAGAADAGAAPDGAVATPLAVAPPVAAPVAKVTVRGRVLARGGRDPVVAAALMLDATPAGETGADGSFELQTTPGRHRLQIQAPGFEPAEVPVITGATAELLIRLNPRLVGERYETVVGRPKEAPGEALVADTLLRTPGSLGDPFRVIESLPGVSQVVWPMALYSVRGANPGNTGFFLDDIRLPALFHFALGPAVIHPHFLEKLEFYPGGYPSRYGRFVAGVVSATTAAPPPDRPRGSMDVRLFDAGAIVTTPINGGQGTVALGGRYSYTGLLFSLFSPSYTLSYWDYQARLDHVLGPGRLTVFAFGSGDDLDHKEEANVKANITFHRLDVRWLASLGPGRLVARSSLGYDRSEVSLAPVVSVPIKVRTLSVAPRLGYLITGNKLDLEIGADSELQRIRPATERDDANEDLFRSRNALVAGGYLSLTWRPTDWFNVTPGFRTDIYFQGEDVKQKDAVIEPGPRLGMRFRPFGDTWLKAQVGRFSQTASLPVAVPGFESFGLGTFGTQTSRQASLGLEQPFGDVLELDVTSFYQRMKLTDLASIFNYDIADKTVLELRDGESYGAEVMLRRPQTHRAYGWLSYTLSWSERLVGPSNARAWSDWDQRHVLNLVGGYRFRGGYSVGARFHLNSGRPYPLFDNDNPSPPDYIRLPTFYQLDLRGERRFVFEKYTLDVYIETVNTTLSRNVFDVKRENGRVEQVAFKIVLPSVGVHAQW
jgi:hypothetical protein